MTDDDFKNLEHTLAKADEDLTAVTKDVEAIKKTQALILEALAELPGFIPAVTNFGDPQRIASEHRQKFEKLLTQIGRLMDTAQS